MHDLVMRRCKLVVSHVVFSYMPNKCSHCELAASRAAS
jgi:hypothetical protein